MISKLSNNLLLIKDNHLKKDMLIERKETWSSFDPDFELFACGKFSFKKKKQTKKISQKAERW